MSPEWITLLKDFVSNLRTNSMFVITVGNNVHAIEIPPAPTGGEPDIRTEHCFLLGRGFALSHPQDWKQARVFQIRKGQQQGIGEIAVVSYTDKQGKEVHAIPYRVVRDRKGKIIDLVDSGGIIEIAGTFLPAFHVGMDTAHLNEKAAFKVLENRMNQWLQQMLEQAKTRGVDRLY